MATDTGRQFQIRDQPLEDLVSTYQQYGIVFNNLNDNKTRETRVLSRPAICWIHYVQIAVSISAEHLSRAPQSRISAEHLSHASQQSSKMLNNAQ